MKSVGRPKINTYFSRLMARGMEAEDVARAALFWQRFLVHGVHEGLFSADGPEAAAIYFRAGSLLSRIDAEELEEALEDFSDYSPLGELYQGQPGEIAALNPKDPVLLMRQILSPSWLLRRSAELDPSTGTFSYWLAWARRTKTPDRQIQEIAELWQRRLPCDVQAPWNCRILPNRADR